MDINVPIYGSEEEKKNLFLLYVFHFVKLFNYRKIFVKISKIYICVNIRYAGKVALSNSIHWPFRAAG